MGGGSAGGRGCGKDLPTGTGSWLSAVQQGPGDPLQSLLPWASTFGSLQPGAQDRAGAGSRVLSWVALTLAPCSAMGSQLHCPWSHSARGAEGAHKGPCGWSGCRPSTGLGRSPGTAGSGSESGALLSCPGKGRCLSPLLRVSSSVSLVPCEFPAAGEAGPVSCPPAVACGTAAERGTTSPKRVVVPLQ